MKKTCNTVKVEFESLSQNEALARSMVSAFMMQLNPTVSEIADMKCAVSEAVTNCIVHAYKERIGKITMTMTSLDNRQIKITVADKGCGIADTKAAMEPLYTTDPENERSGMGFTVMDSFSDSLSVKSKVGKGTKITMKKKLSPIRSHT